MPASADMLLRLTDKANSCAEARDQDHLTRPGRRWRGSLASICILIMSMQAPGKEQSG
jgi:hypothetical protein